MSGIKALPPTLVVGMSGASGIRYGVRLLEVLREIHVDSHLIMSRPAAVTLAHETDLKVREVEALATVVHGIDDIAAAPSSGSFRTLGMVVVPCSMRSLAEMATGVTTNLLTRAADVTLKERRRLVLMPRETPLHAVHLRNMLTVTEMGAIVAPPVPAFYARPTSLDALIDQTIARLLDLFDLESPHIRRWGEDVGPRPRG